MKCTVFLPHGATPPILAFFEQEGAEVKVQGSCYAEALRSAEAEVSSNPNAYVLSVSSFFSPEPLLHTGSWFLPTMIPFYGKDTDPWWRKYHDNFLLV